MELKILTLNLWRYNGEWKERLANIVKLIKREDPDFIFMQEVFDDARHNRPAEHQGKVLNDKLRYKYIKYNPVERVRTEHKMPVRERVYDGLLFLSKHKIISSKLIHLKQHKQDKHKRALQRAVVNIKGVKICLFNIHFSNRDDWSRLHLKEAISIAKKVPQPSILAGDFNIQLVNKEDMPADVKKIYEKTHINSYDLKKYVSFSKVPVTLDYILIPKEYKFISVKCTGAKVSDHKAVVARIRI